MGKHISNTGKPIMSDSQAYERQCSKILDDIKNAGNSEIEKRINNAIARMLSIYKIALQRIAHLEEMRKRLDAKIKKSREEVGQKELDIKYVEFDREASLIEERKQHAIEIENLQRKNEELEYWLYEKEEEEEEDLYGNTGGYDDEDYDDDHDCMNEM